jgi:MFS transporter, FSR family, fosmidomycin resistance protein
MDELVFGLREAAWPLIRRELSLSYLQIGLLLSIPGIASTFVEPGLALLSDIGWRRWVVLGGGVTFVLALFATAAASGFGLLLAATCLLFPASGAFVSLAQATWMDLEPASTERNMARWVLAGSVGAVVGPLLLVGIVGLGSGWRGATVVAALMTVPVLLSARHIRFPPPHPDTPHLRAAVRGAIAALRERRVLRWLTLMQLTDLLGDVFVGFSALYLVDEGGASPSIAAAGVGILSVASLLGDALVIRILRRMDGLSWLRWSAVGALVVYPAFLMVGSLAGKLVLLLPLGLVRSGWYAIVQARLYSELPARGGTAIAVGAPADLVGVLLPLAIASVAERWGLHSAMWLLLGAPIALLTLLPSGGREEP